VTDSHLTDWQGRTLCGERNESVTIPARDVQNPDVRDGLTVCATCVAATMKRLGPPKEKR
jgi:hypothetical protein